MGQETGNRLITAIQKQTEKITYFCTAEKVSSNLAVHEIRKCVKRIRALLKFYSVTPESYSLLFNKQFQNLGRILAPIRESFVNTQIFERVTSGNALIPERKIKQAKELFQEKNRILTESLVGENGEFSRILKLVQEFEFQIKNSPGELPSVKQVCVELCNSYSLSFLLFDKPELIMDGNELHELRKKLKRLWYQLEFVKFMHPRYFRMKSDQLNKITENLGEDHDLYVFLNELNSDGFDFGSDELLILTNLIEHQRELNQLKMNPRIKQFFNEYPEDFNQKMNKIFKVS